MLLHPQCRGIILHKFVHATQFHRVCDAFLFFPAIVPGSNRFLGLAFVAVVRETSGGGDPALSLILDGALTWQSALIVTRAGEKIAVVGNYDADPLKESGDWTEIVPYVQGIKAPLLEVLERVVKNPAPKLAV